MSWQGQILGTYMNFYYGGGLGFHTLYLFVFCWWFVVSVFPVTRLIPINSIFLNVWHWRVTDTNMDAQLMTGKGKWFLTIDCVGCVESCTLKQFKLKCNKQLSCISSPKPKQTNWEHKYPWPRKFHTKFFLEKNSKFTYTKKLSFHYFAKYWSILSIYRVWNCAHSTWPLVNFS